MSEKEENKLKKSNLIPLNQRTKEEAKAIQSKGGSTKSALRNFALLKSKSYKAKCKNCRADCIFKHTNLEQKLNHKCVVPEARAYSIFYNQPIMTEEVLNKLGSETLLKMKGICNDPKDLKLLHDSVMKQKQVDYPKPIQSVNFHGHIGEIKVNIIREDLKDENPKRKR